MNELDIYYRALLNYRAATRDNRECSSFRKAIAQANPEQDQIVVTRNICTVDEDWIQAIEQGLVFVEKALKEERQFIYSNGEVLEIEKVKHISKESVQHLAKHSNLITREQKTDDLIPDKLYSVERLNDYAVYENRFLYMLLCYLRDFVTIRYNKILNLSNKYDGVMHMDKHINLPKRNVTYHAEFHEEKRDDSYLREHNAAKSAIDRIDLILKAILAFLATPLMEITGKAPMLKPPITKTNVLKMDNNFKGAVALYDYILAYDKPGYRIEEKKVQLSPFSSNLAEEMSEVVALSAFLTYAHGLELLPMLKQNYSAEEARLQALEAQKQQQQLEDLKRRLSAKEEGPEAYILALEKQIKLLENENHQVHTLHDQIQHLGKVTRQLTAEREAAEAETDAVRQELSQIEEKHNAQMEVLKEACDDRIHELLLQHEQEMKLLEQSCQEQIDQLRQQMRQREEQLQQQLDALQQELAADEQKILQMQQQYQQLTEEKLLCQARIKAIRVSHGETVDEEDFTQQEQFNQLEQEYQVFSKFYQSNWGKAKKSIRKQLLNYKYLKGNRGQ